MTLLEKIALLGFVFFAGSFFEGVLEEKIVGVLVDKIADAENTVAIAFSLFFMLCCAIAFCAGG